MLFPTGSSPRLTPWDFSLMVRVEGRKTSMDLTTSYKILGLDPQVDEAGAKRAYKAQVRRWHPDQFPDGSSVKATAEEQLKQINIAYARVKAHLSLHRPAPIDTLGGAPPHRSSGGAPHRETSPRQKPQRSWVDHLFDALNAFTSLRGDDSRRSADDHQADPKPKRSFDQVLDEMTGGVNPSGGRSGKTTRQHARRRSPAAYGQYRRQGSRVEGVDPMESKGPVKPVGRVRGIGRNR